MDVGTLHSRHGGRWQVRAVASGGQPPVWSARPWPAAGQSRHGPWKIEASSAEALDKLLTEIDGG